MRRLHAPHGDDRHFEAQGRASLLPGVGAALAATVELPGRVRPRLPGDPPGTPGALPATGRRSVTRTLRILIADDHAVFRRGLRGVLGEEPDIRVVADVADGADAVRLARELGREELDLVLLDIEFAGLDGIAIIRQLVSEVPGLPVVVLTASAAEADLIAAVWAGATGYLSKQLAPAALVRALRDFHGGGALPMSRAAAARVLAYFRRAVTEPEVAPGPVAGHLLAELLTPREREILVLLADGARDREIAEHVVLANMTLKTHVQHILRKLGARYRT